MKPLGGPIIIALLLVVGFTIFDWSYVEKLAFAEPLVTQLHAIHEKQMGAALLERSKNRTIAGI